MLTRVMQDSDTGTHEHVSCLLDTLSVDVSVAQRRTVEEFVRINADVFSKSEYDIGRTHPARHRIDTGDHPPFREPLRRHPVACLSLISTWTTCWQTILSNLLHRRGHRMS